MYLLQMFPDMTIIKIRGGKMYTYKITDISETDKWIYISCNEEDSVYESEPFVEVVKLIAKKWNDNEWQGHISSVGEMRYKVKNDPINLVYQWDDLFGIVLSTKTAQILMM